MPKRRAPTKAVKTAVRKKQSGLCGCRKRCGTVLPPDGKGLVQYQHEPALELRLVEDDDSDWIPPQHSVQHLFAELKACHQLETTGGRSGATSLGSDRHNIDKTRRLRGGGKKRRGPKLQGAGFQKGHRKIPARPFPKRAK